VAISTTFYAKLLCAQIAKGQKDADEVTVFALLRSARIKAGEMLVKSTQENRSLDTSIIKPANPEQGCPKCKGAVYHAEMVSICL